MKNEQLLSALEAEFRRATPTVNFGDVTLLLGPTSVVGRSEVKQMIAKAKQLAGDMYCDPETDDQPLDIERWEKDAEMIVGQSGDDIADRLKNFGLDLPQTENDRILIEGTIAIWGQFYAIARLLDPESGERAFTGEGIYKAWQYMRKTPGAFEAIEEANSGNASTPAASPGESPQSLDPSAQRDTNGQSNDQTLSLE